VRRWKRCWWRKGFWGDSAEGALHAWPWAYDDAGLKAQVEVAFGRRHEPWVLSVRQ
jgi:hypothetical protein